MRSLFGNLAVGLYHPKILIFVFIGLLLANCTAPQITQSLIDVSVFTDQKRLSVQLPVGSTVQETLSLAGIELGNMDRTEPPQYTVLSDSSEVHVIRVREEFFIEQVIIPFENQIVRNELLPIGETRLSQPGVNGLQEITYRFVYENDVEISKSIVKTVVVHESIPEIVMVGSRTPFATISISGRLAYLSNGNAWIIEGTTANRRPVVTTGDLDGQIFSLSADGSWLTFTRRSEEENTINTLWAVEIDNDTNTLIDLNASNIIHFAEWNPQLSFLAYSTVEPRSAPPGWQANNDLLIVGVSSSGYVSPAREEIEPNSGGVYGWWGTMYSWSPDGEMLSYSRPDGIGIFDPDDDKLIPIYDIIPFQTGSDWAWIPGLSWSPDHEVLFTVSHISPMNDVSPEESQIFDLVAIPLSGGAPIHLATDVGMFSYPVPSPLNKQGESSDPDNPIVKSFYQIAFLEAMFPNQSEISRYKLNLMDRDGSNRRVLFPGDGSQGLDPQKINWSPIGENPENNQMIALLYQNNIWLIDTVTELTYQITGDGLTVKIDWK
jgi:resuscitation-promoting factor RpfB